MELRSRKNIRLPAENYLGRRYYFVTICFYRRKRIGADKTIAASLIESLRSAAISRAFLVHAYCVMPDHVHLMAEGAAEDSDLLSFIGNFKQRTAFQFARRASEPLWQSKFYDHILRKADAFESVAWYIWLNPVRRGICRTALDYPFLGSFTDIGAGILQGAGAALWTPPWKAGRAEARPYIKPYIKPRKAH